MSVPRCEGSEEEQHHVLPLSFEKKVPEYPSPSALHGVLPMKQVQVRET
jgi:hypothetical protein